ncbi:MAG: AraC family transcriptional regulator, partial [bacterium]
MLIQKTIIAVAIFLCLPGNADRGTSDNTPPIGRITYPPPAILTSSSNIRLYAVAEDTGKSSSGIANVRFYARYKDIMDTAKFDYVINFIGIVYKKPFEFIWDCSKIPDQDYLGLSFCCDITDSAGNTTKNAGGIIEQVVLDRNKEFSTRNYYIRKTPANFSFNGRVDEWKPLKSQSIFFDDNNLYFWLSWNRRELIIAFILYDRILLSVDKPVDVIPINQYDCIDFLFDIGYERSSFPDSNDFCISVSPSGKIELKGTKSNREMVRQIQYSHYVIGNPLVHSTGDTSWQGEIKIPYKILQNILKKDMKIGFEVNNVDIEHFYGSRNTCSWAGSFRSNLHNPSEWGTLILEQEYSRLFMGIIFGLTVIIIFLIIITMVKRRSAHSACLVSVKGKTRIELAREYLNSNYNDSKLTLDSLAKQIGLSPQHFSVVFKKETGKNFIKYLNRLRIEKAKLL